MVCGYRISDMPARSISANVFIHDSVSHTVTAYLMHFLPWLNIHFLN